MSGARRDFRIVLVDDHALFSEALELALSLEQYDVQRLAVSEVASLAALRSKIERKRPKMVLLDLNLGELGDATSLVEPLTRAGVQVVVVTGAADDVTWGQCLEAGARTVLPKTASLRRIASVVRKIQLNQAVLDVAERERLLAAWRRGKSRHAFVKSRFGRLTDREQQVLGELMLGRTVREVATSSHVSEGTVRTQVKSILAKLEVSSQLAAVGLAHEVGWHTSRSLSPR